MVYTNTEIDIKRREGMGDWMKNYSLSENGKDWDYCVGLSYRGYELKTSNGRRNIKLLFKKLYELDNSVNGFVVDEVDNSNIGIHHHLIVSSSIEDLEFKNSVESVWRNRGLSWIERYDRNKGYVEYMCKHIGKTNRNVFDVFNKTLIK